MIDDSVRDHLVAFPAVAGIVVKRIYPVVLPQNAVFPALTFQIISGSPTYSLDGESGHAETRLQIDCWAVTRPRLPGYDPYRTVRDLAEAVRAAMSGFRGTMGSTWVGACDLDNRRSLHDNATETFRESMDFRIEYEEH